jgi:hypothetical protein
VVTDVKAQEMSLDEWRELLEPYGWADITTHAPAVRFRVAAPILEWEVRLMLKPDREVSQPGGEWAERSRLLDQAGKAVEAVRARGYRLPDAPRVEFGGEYMYLPGETDPRWVAAAELRFTAR